MCSLNLPWLPSRTIALIFNRLQTRGLVVPWQCRHCQKKSKNQPPLISRLSTRSIIHHCLLKWPHFFSPPSHVSKCAGRCLTWSWVRSSTSLRTRRRVDRLPRSCLTSSSTAKPSNSLVHLFLFFSTTHFYFFSLSLSISGCCKFFCRSQSDEFSLALFIALFFWHPTTSCPVISPFNPLALRHRGGHAQKALFFNFSLDIRYSSVPAGFLSHTGHPLRPWFTLSPPTPWER